MRFSRRALALALAYALGAHPVVAQVQSVRLAAPAVTAGAAAASVLSASSAGTPRLQALTLPLSAPFAAPAFSPSAAPAAVAPAAAAARAAIAAAPAPAAPAARAARGLPQIRLATDAAVAGIGRASTDEASGKAGVQFAALTGEAVAVRAGGVAAPAVAASPRAAQAFLAPFSTAAQVRSAEPPAPKLKPWQVFRDPARNLSFWLYFAASSLFVFGYEMFAVAKPYLISSWTTNSLTAHKDLRAVDPEAITELIRSNRALSSVAPGVAEALGYFLMPVFTANARKEGPRKWLVRSTLILSGLLAAVPALFFATGLLSVQASIGVLFGLIAVQAFFLSVSSTTESEATTNLLGDKSVTDAERTKANMILTAAGSVIAVLGRLAAGMFAQIGPVVRKAGASGAVICAVYSGAAALAGLIYATIKMFGAQNAGPAPASAAAAPAPERITLKGLCRSIWEGMRLMFKDGLLRATLVLSTLTAMSDELLLNNVLPEYIESLAARSTAGIAAIMHVPGLGWLVKTLTATSLGNYAFMMLAGSVGVIAAALLLKPLTGFLRRHGFKSEESLTMPFHLLAALQFPLFLLMIHAPTLFGAAALFGLQSLAVGFVGITLSGLQQQRISGQKKEDVNKVLAATSLVGVAAASIAAAVYGFFLTKIAIGTSMLVVGGLMGVTALYRLWAIYKSYRSKQAAPPAGAR